VLLSEHDAVIIRQTTQNNIYTQRCKRAGHVNLSVPHAYIAHGWHVADVGIVCGWYFCGQYGIPPTPCKYVTM